MKVLISYAHKLMVMGSSKNLRVFNFAIQPETRKFDAGEIYMFYSTISAGHHVSKNAFFTITGCSLWYGNIQRSHSARLYRL